MAQTKKAAPEKSPISNRQFETAVGEYFENTSDGYVVKEMKSLIARQMKPERAEEPPTRNDWDEV